MSDTPENNELALPAYMAVDMPAAWGSSAKGTENKRKSLQAVTVRHGLFAGVPIICQGQACPYFSTCFIPQADLQIGERCPIEIAAILSRFDKHCQALGIDPDKIEDTVDAGIVKDVVDIEVMILRCDNLIAISGNMIEEVVAAVTPKGQEIRRPEITKAVELKQDLRRERTRLLNQLMATRKDKKESLGGQDASSVAARIIAKVQKIKQEGRIIDIEPEDMEPVQDIQPDVTHNQEGEGNGNS